MNDQFNRVAEAFSRKASQYDAFGEDHKNLSRMRQKVIDHICSLVPANSYLLELNAGTGLDALSLVQRGYRVHATDLSPGMVAEIEVKIEHEKLANQLTAQRCSFTDLDQISPGPFDAVLSNAGGLNCIADLTRVTNQLPSILKPGGIVTVVIMPRICPWELAHFWKDWQVSTRRLRPGGVMANVAGVQFKTTYFSVRQVRQAFGPRFKLVKQEALSLLTPPADNKKFAHKWPKIYKLLARLDDKVSRWPVLRGWGDFFILSMRYE